MLRAGFLDAVYFRKLERFIADFSERLPKTNRIVMANIKIAAAETLYIQGKLEPYGRLLEKIMHEFSDLFVEFNATCPCTRPPGSDRAA